MEPRVVVVTRQDEVTSLRNTYGTTSNSVYYTRSVGAESSAAVAAATSRSEVYNSAINQVTTAIPQNWRHARVTRPQLDRFLFEADDIIAVVGQDGLVANVSKYLDGQPVIGFNDNPKRNPGVLVPWNPIDAGRAFRMAGMGDKLEPHTMVRAMLDDGQELTGLNEIFVGHEGHQSARYLINTMPLVNESERQSSSGVIVSTGTGATGWCSSIARQSHYDVHLDPLEKKLAFLVREPWVSPSTGDRLKFGYIGPNQSLTITSEIPEGGVIFADGIEDDRIVFGFGRKVTIGVAQRSLNVLGVN